MLIIEDRPWETDCIDNILSYFNHDIPTTDNLIKVALCPGIGDIIYTYYKLIHYVRMGHKFHTYIPDEWPKRGHQILEALEGIEKIDYISYNREEYSLVNIPDLLNPPKNLFLEKSLFLILTHSWKTIILMISCPVTPVTTISNLKQKKKMLDGLKKRLINPSSISLCTQAIVMSILE